MKLTKSELQRYKLICEYTWGAFIIDIGWAIETDIYKEKALKI